MLEGNERLQSNWNLPPPGCSAPYDFFLGDRRRDRQQVYILNAGANGLKVAGLTPEVRVRHSINHSNLDWAFGFRQTEASLMLRHNF